MAGLARVQQRFNMAVVGALAALVSFARGGDKQQMIAAATDGRGYPLARKFLRTQDYHKATGRDLPPYPGYCSGAQERARRQHQRAHAIATYEMRTGNYGNWN